MSKTQQMLFDDIWQSLVHKMSMGCWLCMNCNKNSLYMHPWYTFDVPCYINDAKSVHVLKIAFWDLIMQLWCIRDDIESLIMHSLYTFSVPCYIEDYLEVCDLSMFSKYQYCVILAWLCYNYEIIPQLCNTIFQKCLISCPLSHEGLMQSFGKIRF